MYKASTGDKTFQISLEGEKIELDGKAVLWDMIRLDHKRFHIIRENRSYEVEVLSQNGQDIILRINGSTLSLNVKNKLDLLLEQLGMDKPDGQALNDIKAPMPGLILEVYIHEGDEVQKGDAILILEAMKMENVIKAMGNGIVKSLKIKKGDSVEKNQVLIQF